MAAKYKEYYQNMIVDNQKLFADFLPIHDEFAAGEISQEAFNAGGQKVVDTIRDWDRRLCSAMGKGAYSKYAEKLSEKFWGEARKTYSKIDQVGVKIVK